MGLRNNAVFFYERLGVAGYLKALMRGDVVFYGTRSLPLRLMLQFFPERLQSRARMITFGDLQEVPEIRRNAYGAAKITLAEIASCDWHLRPLKALNENNDLIVEKYLIQQLYEKYEFYGLVNQYAIENPDRQIVAYIDPLHFDPHFFRKADIRIVKQRGSNRLAYLAYIFGIGVYGYYFCRKYAGSEGPVFRNAILCEVDKAETVAMFQDLLAGFDHVHLVARPGYFNAGGLQQFGIHQHALSKQDRRLVREMCRRLIIAGLTRGWYLAKYGKILFELCQMYAHGIVCAADAEDCTYLTFEHLSVEKAVRNEILRSRRTRTAFVPYNIYTSSEFYIPEYRLNYDILCSPGYLCERSYELQCAGTRIILATGSYHANKRNKSRGVPDERVAKLAAFKGRDIAITILSNGIEAITYSGEVRLMEAARRLADLPGVKVFIRQKPIQPDAEYVEFYRQAVGDHESILLTHKEYELYDFLGITDLFVTSNSSSALEFCAAGEPLFSINFWRRTDQFPWQTAVPGVYLDVDTWFDTVVAWINDSPTGQRTAHAKCMQELSRQLAYKFDDFASFKANFLELLKPYLPR